MDDLRRDQTPEITSQLPASDEFGGDSACWANLFDREPDAALDDILPAADTLAVSLSPVDLLGLVSAFQGRGPVMSRRSDDLDLNLLVFRAGEGVAEHVNTTVDVLVVAVAGDGLVTLDGVEHQLATGQLVLITKGVRRRITATSDRFAYLTCHRRRLGLMPVPAHVAQRGTGTNE